MSHFLKYSLLLTLVFFFNSKGYTQLCTGSLGDPVVSIDFGTGPNPGKKLATTTYNFTQTELCPNDSYYAVLNSTQNCFSSTWHDVLQDHTPGDVNGYMMVVNANEQANSVFYLDTVKDLCGGTNYEFSVWIVTLLKSSSCGGNGNMADITFNIETMAGTVLKSYNTGNIPNTANPVWGQYGFFFNLPIGVSDVVIRMINKGPGGCGNDLALDDIAFRPCGPKVDAVITNNSGASVVFCNYKQEPVNFSGAVQSGFANAAFQWQQSLDNGINWNDIAGQNASTLTQVFPGQGIFKFRLTAAEAGNINIKRCRVISNVVTVTIPPAILSIVSNSSPVCVGDNVTLSAQGGVSYEWIGVNNFSSSLATPQITSAKSSAAGKYYVQIKSAEGCIKFDSTLVVINPAPIAVTGNAVSICKGSGTTLQVSGGGDYLWSPSETLSDATADDPVATPAVSTKYTVIVKNQFNCADTSSVSVTVIDKALANAGADKRIIEGESVQLNGVVSGNVAGYHWSPANFIDNVNKLTPIVNPTKDIMYVLQADAVGNCNTSTDTVFIKVFAKVIIPNVFSPNGDGINDVWNIVALDSYPQASIEVFNRYGQLVYTASAADKSWDGKSGEKYLPIGAYYYIIKRNEILPLLTGTISIIR